ncbi:GNAT family N-acetyltransferase [Alkalihalobacillus sp. 1P02AB]|uniref:GNAT family N-acetyltransferase n=1 Tax=Alkalihalobacillus sp. 1P02AB TaxID=3132260 RepID=UPI0039A5B8A9
MKEVESNLTLTKCNMTDIPALIQLSTSVGWDYDQPTLQTVLKDGDVFGFKDQVGNIIASAAIIIFEEKVASIGLVIVKETYRGKGLAKKLMQACLNCVSESERVMLIATEEGKPLYKHLGFVEAASIQKYLCPSFRRPIFAEEPNNIIKYNPSMLRELIELDRKSFGSRRALFLQKRLQQASCCLVAKGGNGQVVGFGLLIPGQSNTIIGPLVAPDNKTALSLISSLCTYGEGEFRIDVPTEKTIFAQTLVYLGFEEVSQPPIMIKNATELPNRNGHLYGIAAQIFG